MSGRTIVIVQGRMTSTRLPGKLLKPLAGKSVLSHVLTRVLAISGIDGVCLAIPDGAAHDSIAAEAAGSPEVTVVRGSEDDVLSRFVRAIEATKAKTVIRVTSDCPFADPAICGGLLALKRATGFGYVRNAFESGLPQGLDAEVIDAELLLTASRSDPDAYEREHVTPFLWRRPVQFPVLMVDHRPNRRDWRFTLDTPADYRFAEAIYGRLYASDPLFGYRAIAELIDREPALLSLNADAMQKPYEGSPDALVGR
jgi:spore coat polysaccharide biosynthesis protein SpsF